MLSSELQLQAYRRQQLEPASPGQLVLLTLGQAVTACRRNLRGQAQRLVEELRGALNLDYAEVAEGMLNLYDWTLHLLREGRLAEAEQVLDELRETWALALSRDGQRKRSAQG